RRPAGRGQPAENRCEDDLQEKPKPERWKRDAGNRERGHHTIEPAATHDGRYDSRRQRQRERDDEGCADQLEGRRNPFEDSAGDRAAVAEAVAPVALCERREPRPVLLPEGT